MFFITKISNRAGGVAKAAINFIRYPSLIDLDRSQWWSYDDLKSFQNRRLRHILDYAYHNIPAYRRKFEEVDARPHDIATADDLRILPITTREEMQDNLDFVKRERITGTLYTGGSTGSPLRYFECFESAKIRWNAHLRGWSWNGYRYGKNRLAVISSSQGIVPGKNVFHLFGDLTEENIRENVRQLLKFKPQHLRGFVSSIYILARYCIDNKVRFQSIKSINVISENLYDYQRAEIEKAFMAEVFEEYVCNDGGACAWECPAHQGLHHCMERAIIEDIDGDAIVTDLWNTAMPFIRYRNGDSITFIDEECRCGRSLPLIRVRGRTNDILISRKGPVSPSFLVHHGSGLVGIDKGHYSFRSGIQAIQYIQKPGFKLVINIIKNPWCSDNEIKEFRKNILKIVPGMEIVIRFVKTIPASPKGKRQFIINEDSSLISQMNYGRRA